MWLLNLFSCVCSCVRVGLFSHSLVFFSSACCYSPSSVPSICHGTSAPCLCLLVGQCQGVRRGQQQGMGMMGGLLIALTAWRAWWQRERRPGGGRPSRATCSPEDWDPKSEFQNRAEKRNMSVTVTATHMLSVTQQQPWLDEWISSEWKQVKFSREGKVQLRCQGERAGTHQGVSSGEMWALVITLTIVTRAAWHRHNQPSCSRANLQREEPHRLQRRNNLAFTRRLK